MPRFVGASNTAGVRNSEEVIKGVGFAPLNGLVRSVGGSLWRRGGKLNGHTSARDDVGRPCVRNGSGRVDIPGASDSASVRGGLRGDSGGEDSDGSHFVGF